MQVSFLCLFRIFCLCSFPSLARPLPGFPFYFFFLAFCVRPVVPVIGSSSYFGHCLFPVFSVAPGCFLYVLLFFYNYFSLGVPVGLLGYYFFMTCVFLLHDICTCSFCKPHIVNFTSSFSCVPRSSLLYFLVASLCWSLIVVPLGF